MQATILIAEDDPFITESLGFLLGREGYDVSTVEDGAAVVDAVQSNRPDLLVLDIMLPEMNGFDVLRRLRGASATRALPVLVLSAKGQEADRRMMEDLGADDYLTKPFSNRELLQRIAGLLARSRPDAELDAGHHG